MPLAQELVEKRISTDPSGRGSEPTICRVSRLPSRDQRERPAFGVFNKLLGIGTSVLCGYDLRTLLRLRPIPAKLEDVSLHQAEQADRRHSDRFPIEREVRYRVLSKRSGEEAGDGRTINISSSGVLFTAQHVLLPGRSLELSISWPAQLNNKCALKLVARGRVVRFENGRAALDIQQYEFRTQSLGGVDVPRLELN
jgi:hypothetical protein